MNSPESPVVFAHVFFTLRSLSSEVTGGDIERLLLQTVYDSRIAGETTQLSSQVRKYDSTRDEVSTLYRFVSKGSDTLQAEVEFLQAIPSALKEVLLSTFIFSSVVITEEEARGSETTVSLRNRSR